MRLIPFRAIYPKLDYITSNDSFFDSVSEAYPDHQANGFFQQTQGAGVYLCQISSPQRTYTGLISCVNFQDYLDGNIKKHEQTLAEKEQKQIQLLLKRQAVVKPILLAYPQKEAIENYLLDYCRRKKPFLDAFFEQEQTHHRVWAVQQQEEILQIQRLFVRHVPTTYIGDGHHRTTIAAILNQRTPEDGLIQPNPCPHLLCALFSSAQLEILNFNRVVDALSEYTPSRFMARLAKVFEIEILKEPDFPRRKHQLTLFVNREWYRLAWREKVLKARREQEVILDTLLFNQEVLQKILNIEDLRTDVRVQYVEGPLGLEGLRRKTLQNEFNAGFCLYPVQLDEVIRLADAGRVLPPKSTWFEPRMKNGLIACGKLKS